MNRIKLFLFSLVFLGLLSSTFVASDIKQVERPSSPVGAPDQRQFWVRIDNKAKAPYVASADRKKQIIEGVNKIQYCMTKKQVSVIMGNADYGSQIGGNLKIRQWRGSVWFYFLKTRAFSTDGKSQRIELVFDTQDRLKSIMTRNTSKLLPKRLFNSVVCDAYQLSDDEQQSLQRTLSNLKLCTSDLRLKKLMPAANQTREDYSGDYKYGFVATRYYKYMVAVHRVNGKIKNDGYVLVVRYPKHSQMSAQVGQGRLVMIKTVGKLKKINKGSLDYRCLRRN